ncbi:MAG: hypothetical protein ACP5F3_01905 [Candidatus Syntrophosphaera sp.]
MKKKKHNDSSYTPDPEVPYSGQGVAPPEESSPQPRRKKRSFGKILLLILVVVILIGILLWILPLEKVDNYTPDQWFKKRISLTSGLPKNEKDAINAIYHDLIARLDHDKPVPTKDPHAVDDYEYLANMDPVLTKYSRLSLLDMMDALERDIEESGKFVKDDFFLNIYPDAEVLQWEVQYSRSSDTSAPSHYFLVRLRNSTGVGISKVLVEIEAPADTSATESTLDGEEGFKNLYTLLPADENLMPTVETFSCPIKKDEFEILDGRGGTATLVKAYLTRK